MTTLDYDVQKTAYDALGDRDGAVVVMEPKTGKILAMVSKPDYDPNTLADKWDDIVSDNSSSVLLNRVTSGLYPPGSTFKILQHWNTCMRIQTIRITVSTVREN